LKNYLPTNAPATNELPGKFETGTQNNEGLAGVWPVEYFGMDWQRIRERRQDITDDSAAALYWTKPWLIHAHELEVSRALLSALHSVPGLRVSPYRS